MKTKKKSSIDFYVNAYGIRMEGRNFVLLTTRGAVTESLITPVYFHIFLNIYNISFNCKKISV